MSILEDLKRFHQECIDSRVEAILQGGKLPTEHYIAGREQALLDSGEIPKPNWHEWRMDVYLDSTYDTLEAINTENPGSLDAISVVQDRLLELIVESYRSSSRSDQDTRSDFAERVKSSIDYGYLVLRSFIRVETFLRLLENDPSKSNRLKENSCYFPWIVFGKKKQIPLEYIAEQILGAIPPELVPKIAAVVGHLENNDIQVRKQLGPFKLPVQGAYIWAECTDEEQAVTELTQLFCEGDTPKAIYYALAACFSISLNSSPRQGWSDQFKPTRSEYNMLKLAMLNYARNQILGKFQSDHTIGLVSPVIAYLNLRPSLEGDNLIVTCGPTQYTSPTDSKFFRTTHALPLAAIVLNRFYETARRYVPDE